MRRARSGWLTLGIATGLAVAPLSSEARKRSAAAAKGAIEAAKGSAAAVVPLDVSIAEGGGILQVHVEGGRMRVRSSVAGEKERPVSAADEVALTSAARGAIADGGARSRCDGAETWVSVTVEGRTRSAALCSEPRPDDASWRSLVERIRALLVAPVG